MFLPLFPLPLLLPLTLAAERDLDRSPAPTPLHQGRAAALIIGVEAYKSVSPLRYAVDDAQAVARALIESGSFAPGDVVMMTTADTNDPLSPTYTHIFEQLTALQARRDLDLLVVYFSGHGGASTDGKIKENYLFPLDVSPTVLEQTGVPMTEVLHLVEQVPATARLVLVDACRDQSKSLEGSGGFVPMGRQYDLQGTVTVFATPFDQTAQEVDSLGHGAFTAFAVEALEGSADGTLPGQPADGVVSLDELYQYTRQRLATVPRVGGPQVPVRAGEVQGGDLAIVQVPRQEQARCPATGDSLNQAQEDALRLCAAQDPSRFTAAATRARASLDCLSQPLSPRQDLRDHQIGALYAASVHDELGAAREWRAATWTAQEAGLSLELPQGCGLPEPIRAQAERLGVGLVPTPRAPPEGAVTVGGLERARMPSPLPLTLQVDWGYGVADLPTRWDGEGQAPVLSDAVRPPIAGERARGLRLALGAGGAAAVSGGLWALSALAERAYVETGECIAAGETCGETTWDPEMAREKGVTEERRLRWTTNALGAGAVVTGGVSVGLGVVAWRMVW